jgi:hypothetical protein
MLYPVFTAAFTLSAYYSVKKFDRSSAEIGALHFEMGRTIVSQSFNKLDQVLAYYRGKHAPQFIELIFNIIINFDDRPEHYIHPRAPLVTLKNTFILGSTILTDLVLSKVIHIFENYYFDQLKNTTRVQYIDNAMDLSSGTPINHSINDKVPKPLPANFNIRANDILYPNAENNLTVGEGIKLTSYTSSSDIKVEKIIEYGGFAQSYTFNSAGTELAGAAGTALIFQVNERISDKMTRGSGATNQVILENLAQQINEKSTGDYSVRARVVTQYVGGVLKSTLLVAPEKANYSLYFLGDSTLRNMIGFEDVKNIKQFQISSSSDVIGRFASLQDLKEQIDNVGISVSILSTYAVGTSLTILSSNPLFLENYNKGSGSNFLADLLIENVVGINAKYKDGNTALIVALTERDFDKAKFLINNGADINAKSKDGISPLSLVIRMEEQNEADMAKYLLQYCANPNDADSLGQSLLHIAAVRTNLEVIDLLFKYGANPYSKDHAGNIPEQYTSNQEVAEFIAQKTEEYDAHITLHQPFETCEPLSEI